MDREAFVKQLTQWRHQLHQHPETAFEEVRTSAFVADILEGLGYEVVRGVGKTGVVASLKEGESNRVIGLRADMDANAITETGDTSYRSQVPGKMHACGHDGHVTTLLGAAVLLAESRDFDGTVRLIFQPAEEPGYGAAAMMEDGLFTRFPVDEIYGLHNMPGLPAGTFHMRTGGIMASEDNFTIQIHGKGGHASSPHMGTDPLVIASQVILGLQTIVSRNASPLQSAVVSCTEIHTDGAHNALPSNVVITGDTRSFSPEMQELIETRMRGVCEGICTAGGATCEFTYTHEFAPTINHPMCVMAAAEAARAVVGAEHVNENCEPTMVSEDFALYLRQVPGCFVFLGSKDERKEKQVFLHNAEYDYNDAVLETGAKFFAELVRQRLVK